MARVITDPQGRTWTVSETGRLGSLAGGDAVLECTSRGDRFVVRADAGWRDTPNDELWEQLDQARRQQPDDDS